MKVIFSILFFTGLLVAFATTSWIVSVCCVAVSGVIAWGITAQKRRKDHD